MNTHIVQVAFELIKLQVEKLLNSFVLLNEKNYSSTFIYKNVIMAW